MSTMVYRTASSINDSMIRVYNYMFIAIINSMIVSYLISNSKWLMSAIFDSPLKWVVIFSPLVFSFIIPGVIRSGVSKFTAQVLLQAFASMLGLCLATLFVSYTSLSIVSAFMGAGVLFGIMSFYGYFTKQSLDELGKYMFVGLIAVIVAGIINVFIGNSVLQMVISTIAIVVFLGLTAYDTQRIREELMTNSDHAVEITGALSLYLNFINLFTNLLSLFGNKEE